MVAALGGGDDDDPLELLGSWYEAHGRKDPGSYLREAGVPMTFWNRIGD